MNIKNHISDESGQAETLGFAIIFSIIILSVVALYASGAADLSGVQENAKSQNAEKALTVLATNIEDITHRNAPSRATEIRLDGTTMSTSTSSRIIISVKDESAPDSAYTTVYDEESDVFKYGTKKADIDYMSGAVFRVSNNQDGGVMLREPEMRFNDNRVFVNSVILNGGVSIGGSQTVLVTTDEESSSLAARETGSVDKDMRIEIQTSEAKAGLWAEYFSQQGLTDSGSDLSNGIVQYEYTGTDSIVVSETKITVGTE